MRREIYHPKDLPKACNVFIAFPFSIAGQIRERMKSYSAKFYIPSGIKIT